MKDFDLKKYLAENKLLKEELRDAEDILVKAGFRFDDGLLGGVGSGGAGYYDFTNDKIYGYNQSGPWNEEEFSKFYDNFEFNSNLYDREEMEEDLEIDTSIIFDGLDNGIYAVGDMGYVEIHIIVSRHSVKVKIHIYHKQDVSNIHLFYVYLLKI